MKACATAGGGVMFIPDNVPKKTIQLSKKTSNDNPDVSSKKDA